MKSAPPSPTTPPAAPRRTARSSSVMTIAKGCTATSTRRSPSRAASTTTSTRSARSRTLRRRGERDGPHPAGATTRASPCHSPSRPPRAISSASPATAEAEHPARQGHRRERLDRGFRYLSGPREGHAGHHRVAFPLGAEGQGRMGRGFAERGAHAGAANGPPRHRPLPAHGQVAGGQLPELRPADRRRRQAEGRSRRPGRDAHLLSALGKNYAECAEPIPGPSTKYFGELAKKHNLYIVAGLLERDRHLVYNVAVLIGPGREHRRQVSQGLPAARRGRGRALRPGTNTRSSRRASARSA